MRFTAIIVLLALAVAMASARKCFKCGGTDTTNCGTPQIEICRNIGKIMLGSVCNIGTASVKYLAN